MREDLPARIRVAAETSVGRAAGFAALAIGCVVLALSSYSVLALRTGAVLCLLAAAILYQRALAAPERPYRRTEIWLILDRPRNLPEELAQRLIGETLRSTLERYARWYAAAAAGFWLVSLIWFEPGS